MPLAKIHFVEGRYDEAPIAKVSGGRTSRSDEYTRRLLPTDFRVADRHGRVRCKCLLSGV